MADLYAETLDVIAKAGWSINARGFGKCPACDGSNLLKVTGAPGSVYLECTKGCPESKIGAAFASRGIKLPDQAAPASRAAALKAFGVELHTGSTKGATAAKQPASPTIAT